MLQSISPNIPYRFYTSLFFSDVVTRQKEYTVPVPNMIQSTTWYSRSSLRTPLATRKRKKEKNSQLRRLAASHKGFRTVYPAAIDFLWLLKVPVPPSSSTGLRSHRPRAQGVRKMYLDCIQAMRTAGSVQLGFPGSWRCFKSFAFFNRQAIRPWSLSLFSWCQTERI